MLSFIKTIMIVSALEPSAYDLVCIFSVSSEEYDFDISVPKPPSFGSSTKVRGFM